MEETTNGGLKFCENCGARLQPGAKFCDNCGQKIVYAGEPVFPPVPAEEPQKQEQAQQGSAYQQNDYQQNNYQQSAQQGAGRPSSNAVLPAKLGCALAYLFPLIGCAALYFLGDRQDDFVRHHLNQAICLCILQIIRYAIHVDILQSVLSLILLFGFVVGMYGSITGKKTEIPLISQVKII